VADLAGAAQSRFKSALHLALAVFVIRGFAMPITEDEYHTRHAALIGGVSLAWNDVHSMVLFIFADLSGMPWERAEAVYFALKADQAQRDITIALIQTVLASENDRPLRELGSKLMGQIGGLAGDRNLANHAMWVTMHPSREIVPHPYVSRSKLVKEDYEAQFSVLTQRLRKLFRELLDFRSAVRVHLGLP
jgi:hypothetical protein